MADRHAGFATAVAIGQRTLDTLARLIYSTSSFDHWLTGSAPGDKIFLDAPRFELKTANQGRIGLKLTGRGPVTVGTERRDCELELLILLTPRPKLINARLGLRLDGLTATVATLSVRPFAGSSFSAATQTYLDSAMFKGLIEFGIQVELSKRGSLLPPFDVSFLGAVATDPSTTASLAVVDGALVVGLDITAGGVQTMGDTTLLTNFLGDRDIGMWTNPAVVETAFGSMRAALATKVAKEGATIRSFSLVVEEGGFRVNVEAANNVQGINVSVLASPRIDKGGNPARDRLWFALSEEQVSSYSAWWILLFDVLSLGIVAGIVEFMVAVVRNNVVNDIKVHPSEDVSPLTLRFTLPGVTEPAVMLRIVAFECHDEGVFAGLRLNVDFPAAKIIGPTAVAADEVPALAAKPLVYRVDLGFDALPDDPTLRARWIVRIPGSSTSLLVQDEKVATGGGLLNITGVNVPLLTSSDFLVECRLYRVSGAHVEELFDRSIALSVQDRLDRTHPYVRWTHRALVPVVRVEADGSKSILGEAIKTRASRLHRTAVPGRCRMASRYSQSWMGSGDGVPGPTLEYLDALPFARADLVARRAQVCDYCFFGGPTRSVPLIP